LARPISAVSADCCSSCSNPVSDRRSRRGSANGANLPVSVDQLKDALGDPHLRQLAAQLGLPVDQLLGQLSQHLPGAVDHMSPRGTLEEQLGPG